MWVIINPYIDCAEKETQKASTGHQKVKSKCMGSASASSCSVRERSEEKTDSSRNGQTQMGGN